MAYISRTLVLNKHQPDEGTIGEDEISTIQHLVITFGAKIAIVKNMCPSVRP